MKKVKSKLVTAPVGRLQSKIISTMKSLKGAGIYVSLNKSGKKMEREFVKNKVDMGKLFFIDCVDSENFEKGIIHISPAKLDNLSCAINAFADDLEGKKFLVIDALSVLLIYNNENQVASFVRKVTQYASHKDVEVVAFAPKTKGEELLNKIFGFFDKVEGK